MNKRFHVTIAVGPVSRSQPSPGMLNPGLLGSGRKPGIASFFKPLLSGLLLTALALLALAVAIAIGSLIALIICTALAILVAGAILRNSLKRH